MSLIPSLDSTLGALTIGFTVSTFLLGISTTQLYLYLINFPHDKPWMKVLVWTVWLLELAHFVAIAHTIYDILVSNFGNILNLVHTPIGLHVSSFTGVVVSTVVKGFFIFRIWHLSRSHLLTAVLSLLALGAAGAYLASNAYAILNDNALLYADQYGWLLITCSSISAGCDIAISISLIWLLRSRLESAGNHPGTTKIVEKLTAWTLETGSLTSAFNVGLAVSVGINTRNFIWLAFWFCLCRCYVNSMLATLNGRKVLRSIEGKTESYSLPSTSFGIAPSSSHSTDMMHDAMDRQFPSGGQVSFKTQNDAFSNDVLDIRGGPTHVGRLDRDYNTIGLAV